MITRILLERFRSFQSVDINLTGRGNKPLPYVLVYGENGSGKTNLIDSLRFLQDTTETILDADRIDALRDRLDDNVPQVTSDDALEKDVRLISFHLRRVIVSIGPITLSRLVRENMMVGSDEPMHLRFEFLVGDRPASYDLVFGSDYSIISEELQSITESGRFARLFQIQRSDDGIDKKFGKSVLDPSYKKELVKRIDRVWGKNTLLAILKSEYRRNSETFMAGAVSRRLKDVMEYIDSISVFTGTLRRDATSGMEEGIMPRSEAGILDVWEELLNECIPRLSKHITGVHYETQEDGDDIRYNLRVSKMIAGEVRTLSSTDESAGIRNTMFMLPFLTECFSGSVSVIDEMDSGIHDKLGLDLMSMMVPEIDGQLIVTTHNTSLLETADPRNVFVIRIDDRGFREVVSFNSICPTKKNHNNRLRYMQGVFGGIPSIGQIDMRHVASRYHENLTMMAVRNSVDDRSGFALRFKSLDAKVLYKEASDFLRPIIDGYQPDVIVLIHRKARRIYQYIFRHLISLDPSITVIQDIEVPEVDLIGSKVLILDDSIRTGESIIKAIKAIRRCEGVSDVRAAALYSVEEGMSNIQETETSIDVMQTYPDYESGAELRSRILVMTKWSNIGFGTDYSGIDVKASCDPEDVRTIIHEALFSIIPGCETRGVEYRDDGSMKEIIMLNSLISEGLGMTDQKAFILVDPSNGMVTARFELIANPPIGVFPETDDSYEVVEFVKSYYGGPLSRLKDAISKGFHSRGIDVQISSSPSDDQVQ